MQRLRLPRKRRLWEAAVDGLITHLLYKIYRYKDWDGGEGHEDVVRKVRKALDQGLGQPRRNQERKDQITHNP